MIKKLFRNSWKTLGLGLVLALLGLLMISSAVLADSGDCSADLSNNGPVCAANSCCSTERMIGTVNIATTGFYRVETTVNYNSGDEQKNESFYLVIENSDVQSARDMLEKDFLEVLGISEKEACKLKITLSVPFGVNEDLAGENYGLSFCPNGKKFFENQ